MPDEKRETEDLERPRILVDIKTMDDARRVEEIIKIGYIQVALENISNWIRVEEDLSESYEKFSRLLSRPEERETANALHMLSSSDAEILRKKLMEFEGLNEESRKRINIVKKLANSV